MGVNGQGIGSTKTTEHSSSVPLLGFVLHHDLLLFLYSVAPIVYIEETFTLYPFTSHRRFT